MKYYFVFLAIFFSSTSAFHLFRPPTSRAPKNKGGGSDAVSSSKSRKRIQPTPPPPPESTTFQLPDLPDIPEDINPLTPSAWNSMTSAALTFASKFAPKQIRANSDRAARVQLNRLPPQSVKVDLNDVPLVGPAISGTYAKVRDVPKPSVVIASPKDKLGAVQDAANTGNLEFGLSGLFRSSLDIQLEPNKPGRAPLEIKSPLIPKWPFGRKESDWNKVTNMGNGEVYYFNSRTGETQTKEPADI